eukprot:56347-Prymnesium_polylepis.1
MPGYDHQAGDMEPRPYVDRDPRKGQGVGEIPGAELRARSRPLNSPSYRAGGRARKESPRWGTHTIHRDPKTCIMCIPMVGCKIRCIAQRRSAKL